MKKLTTQILSIILTLSIAFSLAVPAFAASNTSAYQNIAPEDIASIQETYNSLTPEAKKLYKKAIKETLTDSKSIVSLNTNGRKGFVFIKNFGEKIGTEGGTMYVNGLHERTSRSTSRSCK